MSMCQHASNEIEQFGKRSESGALTCGALFPSVPKRSASARKVEPAKSKLD